jgi:hypothetical protein
MTVEEIASQLERIAASDDFAARSAELAESWSSAEAGIEVVEPILRFMEEHPSIEFGMPGALVHFIERFYGKGYDEKLVQSVERKPTAQTVWMLNRVINGAKTPAKKEPLVKAMEHARLNPATDHATLQLATRFLERLSQ